MKQRLQFIDMAKGIAIICIVFYHILAPSVLRTIMTGCATGALYVFFILSGYLCSPGKRSLRENITCKIKALLVPFFWYSLSFWTISTLYYMVAGTFPFVEALYCLRNFYAGCIWNRTIQDWFSLKYYSLGKRYLFLADFWFLLALLLAYILFFIVVNVNKVMESKTRKRVALILLLTTTGVLRYFRVFLPYNLQLIPFWTACLLLGTIIKERGLYSLPFMRGSIALISSTVAIGIGTVILCKTGFGINVFRGTFDWFEPVTMIILFLCGMIIVWGLGSLCKFLEGTGMRIREIAWLGSHSLYIFLFHMFYAWLISVITGFSLLYKEHITDRTVAVSILIAFASLALSILTGVAADFISKKAIESRLKSK